MLIGDSCDIDDPLSIEYSMLYVVSVEYYHLALRLRFPAEYLVPGFISPSFTSITC